MLKMLSTCINARMDTSDHGLSHSFKEFEALRRDLQASKMPSCSVPSFSVRANYAGTFKCPHRQKSKGLMSGERGGCTSKIVCGHILILTFLSVLMWELTPEICPRILDSSCTYHFPTYIIRSA
jgi:hypothetical protein